MGWRPGTGTRKQAALPNSAAGSPVPEAGHPGPKAQNVIAGQADTGHGSSPEIRAGAQAMRWCRRPSCQGSPAGCTGLRGSSSIPKVPTRRGGCASAIAWERRCRSPVTEQPLRQGVRRTRKPSADARCHTARSGWQRARWWLPQTNTASTSTASNTGRRPQVTTLTRQLDTADPPWGEPVTPSQIGITPWTSWPGVGENAHARAPFRCGGSCAIQKPQAHPTRRSVRPMLRRTPPNRTDTLTRR